jgi:hypothetical protein
MQTIRQNVFETNSSSTHSVTVRTIGQKPNKDVRPLVQDGVLYASHLKDYQNYLGYGDGGHTLNCVGIDMKTALVAHWIWSAEDDEDITKEQSQSYQKILLDKLPYEEINFDGLKNSWDAYTPTGEYDGADFDLTGDTDDDFESLNRAIGWILDDKIEIIDADIPD